MTARKPLVNNSGTVAELPTTDSLSGNGTVPSGGTAGQSLTKQSGTDYDVAWVSKVSGSITVSVVASLPATPDANTLYIVTG